MQKACPTSPKRPLPAIKSPPSLQLPANFLSLREARLSATPDYRSTVAHRLVLGASPGQRWRTFSDPSHFVFRYSQTSRRWQWCGLSSEHRRHPPSNISGFSRVSILRCSINRMNEFSYTFQSPLSRLNAFKISSVGAKSGWCVYCAPQIVFKKKARSSAFANPDNCDVLWSRTSITFLMPAFFRRSKKRSAVVLVKPIVAKLTLPKSFTPHSPASGHCSASQKTRPS